MVTKPIINQRELPLKRQRLARASPAERQSIAENLGIKHRSNRSEVEVFACENNIITYVKVGLFIVVYDGIQNRIIDTLW